MADLYWKYLLVLLLCGVRASSVLDGRDVNADQASGDDSSSGAEQDFHKETKTETVVHEITAATLPQRQESNKLTTPTASPDCVQDGSCGITESPAPTKVLDIDFEEDSGDPDEADEKGINFEPLAEIRQSLDDIQKEQKEEKSKNEVYFSAILKALSQFDKEKLVGNVAQILEEKFSEKFAKLENGLEHISQLLSSTKITKNKSDEFLIQETNGDLKHLNKPTISTEETHIPDSTAPGYLDLLTAAPKEESRELVATDTWSYIDSKFSEFNAKLLDANERIRRDLEEKIETVWKKYVEKEGDETRNASATNQSVDSTKVDRRYFLSEAIENGEIEAHEFKNQYGMMELKDGEFQENAKQNIKGDKTEITEYLPSTTAIASPKWTTTVASDQSKTVLATPASPPVTKIEGTTLAPPSVEVILASIDLEKDDLTSATDEDTTSTKASSSLFTLLANLYAKLNDNDSNSTLTGEYEVSRHSKEQKNIPDEESALIRESVKFEALPLTMQPNSRPTPKPAKHDFPQHCAEIYLNGTTKSGVYRISPFGRGSWKVYCDMDTDGGGWTVIQRRTLGNVNFTRGWEDYKIGFGSVGGDFWFGLERMHMLTSNYRQKLKMSLRIELKDWSGVSQFAHYNTFKVGSEQQSYRLLVKSYHGTAGNAMQYGESYNHNLQKFTTIDRDNDGYTHGNCGSYYGSGWWFNACFAANLNGRYYGGTYHGIQNGIYWGTWYRLNEAETNARHSFRYVDMKIRPADFLQRRKRNHA